MTNDELLQVIQKSLVGTSTGGIVPDDAVREFVTLMTDQTGVFQNIRVESDITTRRTIDGIEFGDYVISEGVEATPPASGDIHAPDMPRLVLDPKKVVAAVDISFDFLRKNIRQDQAETDINNILALRVGMDLVSLMFNGDTTLGTTTRKNRALRILDGILKKADGDSDVHDVTIAASPAWATAEFSKMLSALPKPIRENRQGLRHFVSVDVLDAYEDEIGARETAAADAILFGPDAVRTHKRVRVVPVYDFPDNTVVTTPGSNVVAGFGREMQLWRELDTRKQVLKVTLVADFDAGYIFSDAVALGEQAG